MHPLTGTPSQPTGALTSAALLGNTSKVLKALPGRLRRRCQTRSVPDRGRVLSEALNCSNRRLRSLP